MGEGGRVEGGLGVCGWEGGGGGGGGLKKQANGFKIHKRKKKEGRQNDKTDRKEKRL